MQIIKWTLGVHKRASNIWSYGECGRIPIGISSLPQILRYFLNSEKLSDSYYQLNSAVDTPLAILAFREQKQLQLKWYTIHKGICDRHSKTRSIHAQPQVESIKRNCEKEFIDFWCTEKDTQSRLIFYSDIKSTLN